MSHLASAAGKSKILLLIDEVQSLGRATNGVDIAASLRAGMQTNFERYEAIEVTGGQVTKGGVQRAMQRLRNESVLYQDAGGKFAVDSALLAEWLKQGQPQALRAH